MPQEGARGRLLASPAMAEDVVKGTLAFVGGSEWSPLSTGLDRALLERAGGAPVVVIPTAAAFGGPAKVEAAATACFEALGAEVIVIDALHREEAEDKELIAPVRDARFIYIADGSPLHLRSVLKDSALFKAIRGAWRDGAVLAASGAGATLLADPMVDPRGGAYTVGFGLVTDLAVFPHHGTAPAHLLERSLELLPRRAFLAGVDDHTALVREADGTWRVIGDGWVTVYTHTDGPVATQIGSYAADSVIDTLSM